MNWVSNRLSQYLPWQGYAKQAEEDDLLKTIEVHSWGIEFEQYANRNGEQEMHHKQCRNGEIKSFMQLRMMKWCQQQLIEMCEHLGNLKQWEVRTPIRIQQLWHEAINSVIANEVIWWMCQTHQEPTKVDVSIQNRW